MKYKKHILSFIIIILMIVFTVATKTVYNYPSNEVHYRFENEYLEIEIRTRANPKHYTINNKSYQVDIQFGKNKSQDFMNFINENNENKSYYIIVDKPNKWEKIEYGDYVYETSFNNVYYIIKIKKELLMDDFIGAINIYLFNKTTNKTELYSYWDRGYMNVILEQN
jgi:hypothetical protein